LCEICDYTISKGHNIVGPFTEASAPPQCYAGDEKETAYFEFPSALNAPSDECTSDEMCDTGAVCVMDEDSAHFGQCVVPCTTSEDCESFNVSALCGTDGDLKGLCYVPNPKVSDAIACKPTIPDPDPYVVPMYDTSDEALAYAETHPDEPAPTTIGPVACKTNDDCILPPGVGGVCERDPSKKAYGYCIDIPRTPYLEWRDEVQMFSSGAPPSRNVCLETVPYARKWCEMPWTRTGANPDDLSLPLDVRVKDAWKTKARPPFWYDERDGTCHVTRTYCEANLENGGMSAGYGRNTNYFLGNTCSGGSSREVTGAYDCCTKLGNNISEMFLGRTITTGFAEAFDKVFHGDVIGGGEQLVESYDEFTDGFATWMADGADALLEKAGMGDVLSVRDVYEFGRTLNGSIYNDLMRKKDPQTADMLDFVSDPRLKHDVRMVAPHVFSGGVHGYEWVWNETASRLYGLSGVCRGVLTSEVGAVNPEWVTMDAHGFYHVHVPRSCELAQALTRFVAAVSGKIPVQV